MKHLLSLIFQKSLFPILVCVPIFSACVSVNLPSSETTRAANYMFEAPASPFQKMKTDNADHAWLSSKTGNTIAVLTECNPKSNRSLKSIETETVNAVNNPKILESNTIEYNGREAVQSIAEGSVDGVAVKLFILAFQKNSCNYTISLIGRSTLAEKELNAFEKFKKGFVAQ